MRKNAVTGRKRKLVGRVERIVKGQLPADCILVVLFVRIVPFGHGDIGIAFGLVLMPVVIHHGLEVCLLAQIEIGVGIKAAGFIFRPVPRAIKGIFAVCTDARLGSVEGLALFKALPHVAHHDVHIISGGPAADDVGAHVFVVGVFAAACTLLRRGIKAFGQGKKVLFVINKGALQVVEVLPRAYAGSSHSALIVHPAIKKIHVLCGKFKFFSWFGGTQVHHAGQVVVACEQGRAVSF